MKLNYRRIFINNTIASPQPNDVIKKENTITKHDVKKIEDIKITQLDTKTKLMEIINNKRNADQHVHVNCSQKL